MDVQPYSGLPRTSSTTQQHFGKSTFGSKRKKRALQHIALQKISWGTEHDAAIAGIQDNLHYSVKLPFLNQNHVICVITDGFVEFCEGVVTQAHDKQMNNDIEKQKHETMAFLGGKLAGSQRNCTSYEKEAYAIVPAFGRVVYLIWKYHPVHVSTDLRNFLFISALLASQTNSPRHV